MEPNTTTLERAFQLASSGEMKNLEGLRNRLKSEGYNLDQLQGQSLLKQLRQMIRDGLPVREPRSDGCY